MAKRVCVRSMTDAEVETIKAQAHSRTEAARDVERAKIIWLSHAGQSVTAIAADMQLSDATVRLWLKRFNAQGLAGLSDQPRAGRPATYTPDEVGAVIAAALTNPKRLGLPFAAWTLDRLEASLNEVKGIAIKRTRIDDILVSEGLRWRKQETWFGERVDPDFAEKRGSSPGSTPNHRLAA